MRYATRSTSSSISRVYRKTYWVNAARDSGKMRTAMTTKSGKRWMTSSCCWMRTCKRLWGHGNQALAIINGILLYSRGKGDACLPTDAVGLTREYVRLSYHAMRANYKGFNAAIEEEYEEGMPPVNLMPQDYIRMLLNVMNNAWYAVWKRAQQEPSGYRPTVRIGLHRTDGNLVLVVEDNGTGMDKETQENIYEIFYTTKPAGHGTGLGMAIVKDIIENKHRGRIAFTSVPGEGTCFTLSIPLDL